MILILPVQDYRQNVWTENVRFISSHNGEYEDGLHDFSVGENEFADMTQQEITSYFNGLAMEESSPSGQTFSSAVSLESLPAEVDWRKNVSSYPWYCPWLSLTSRAQSLLSRTRDTVAPAGHSAPQAPWREHTSSRLGSWYHSASRTWWTVQPRR